MSDYLFISIIAALAGFTQGLSGFGSIIVSVPLLALFLDIKTVIPLANILALSINLLLFPQFRRRFAWKEIAPLLLASIPGIRAGTYILETVDPWLLQLIIGVVLLCFSIYYLCAGPREQESKRRQAHARWAWVSGFFSGCLGGSIGMTGPPVVVYISLLPWDKDVIKSTLIGYFLATGIGISALHAANGLITAGVVRLGMVSLPALALGVFLGSACYGKIDDVSYRRITTMMLLILGIVMVWKALRLHIPCV